MEEYKRLLSILIPTKDRYDTLFVIINSILNFIDSVDFEVVIQDNSKDNSLAIEYFKNLDDDRVKYFYSPLPVSVSNNTELAINNSNGKYLMFVGDDDLISPYVCDFVNYINNNGISALVYTPGYYWWNTVEFDKETKYKKKKALILPRKVGFSFKKLSTKTELSRMLSSGAGTYSLLPKLYHGIVLKDKIELIKLKTGTYVPGASPDISLSTSLCFILDEYYFVDYPLSVYGASSKSGGGMTAQKKHFGKIENQPFLPESTKKYWNDNLPKIWSERSIYAQSVLEVFRAFNKNPNFNYLYFYSVALAYEPYLLKYILPCILNYCKNSIPKYFQIVLYYIKLKLGQQFRNLIKTRTQTNIFYDLDIPQVMNRLHLLKLGILTKS